MQRNCGSFSFQNKYPNHPINLEIQYRFVSAKDEFPCFANGFVLLNAG